MCSSLWQSVMLLSQFFSRAVKSWSTPTVTSLCSFSVCCFQLFQCFLFSVSVALSSCFTSCHFWPPTRLSEPPITFCYAVRCSEYAALPFHWSGLVAQSNSSWFFLLIYSIPSLTSFGLLSRFCLPFLVAHPNLSYIYLICLLSWTWSWQQMSDCNRWDNLKI